MKLIREPITDLNTVEIQDNMDPIVEVNKVCPNIFIDLKPEVIAHEKKAYLRSTVCNMLNKAQSLLPQNHRLRVWDAWRDPVRQEMKYKKYYNQLQKKHPNWPKSTLRRQTNQMLFPVDVKTPPPHSTGAAVDLTITDSNGDDLDMMSPYTHRYDEAITSSRKISNTAQKNRKLLYDIMNQAGFTNYSFEWWHYTYGDSAWALRLGKKVAIYDRASPPNWK